MTIPNTLSPIAIMGAGAVGCYFGGMLARAGHPVTLIGRPAHVDAVRAQGLRLQTATWDERMAMSASAGPEGVAGAQLVLFCVKSTDTDSAGAAMAPHLAPGALVLDLQNGADNAPRLAAVLPGHEVLATVVYVATEMAGPGHVLHHGRGDLVLADGPRSAAVAAQLAAAGVPVQLSANVTGALWAKLVLNSAFNAISAITRLPYGDMVQGEGMWPTLRAVVDECLAVAHADGVQLPGDVWDGIERIVAGMPTQYSSTAQDLMRGKPTEIDHINGYVLRRGDALGVPVPLNRMLHSLVKLLEQRGAQAGEPPV